MKQLMRRLRLSEQTPVIPVDVLMDMEENPYAAVVQHNQALQSQLQASTASLQSIETENAELRRHLQTIRQENQDLKTLLDTQAREHGSNVGTLLHVYNNPGHGIKGCTELLERRLSCLRKTVEKGSQDTPTDPVQQMLLDNIHQMHLDLHTVKECATQQLQATDAMLQEYQRKTSRTSSIFPTTSPPGSPLAPTRFIPKKVLVVDDELFNRRLALQQLKQGLHPPSADIADNGQEAVTQWQAAIRADTPYDVIIMDVMMPIMNGLEATQAIRAYESEQGLKPVYIIGLSANALDKDKLEAFHSGMDAYLTKPCDAQTLLAAIANKPIPGPASNTASSPEMTGDDDLTLEAINGFTIDEHGRSNAYPSQYTNP